jgi:hypothetical protein
VAATSVSRRLITSKIDLLGRPDVVTLLWGGEINKSTYLQALSAKNDQVEGQLQDKTYQLSDQRSPFRKKKMMGAKELIWVLEYVG